jgi:hypothetical protein
VRLTVDCSSLEPLVMAAGTVRLRRNFFFDKSVYYISKKASSASKYTRTAQSATSIQRNPNHQCL